MTTEAATAPRRKLRVLVITMPGSERKAHIEAMFAGSELAAQFEPPQFSHGVPSRSLRNRFVFLKTCHEAGLLPQVEWQAIEAKQESLEADGNLCPNIFFDCLEGVPVATSGTRRGSPNDVKLHYSVELWRKAKTINRGRAVLGCTLAHLIALKRFTTEGFDVMLEDNVRMVTKDAAQRIWKAKEASEEHEKNGEPCHLRFLGWLGSIPNLQWILTRHVPQQAKKNGSKDDTSYTVVPFPKTQDIMEDLKENGELDELENNCDSNHHKQKGKEEEEQQINDNQQQGPKNLHTQPGGTPVWGSYAYWMSKEGYEALLHRLQNDVGALLWKGKRGRFYHVKPADKILPRTLLEASLSVQLSTCPAFFRAPMLTSQIHTAYDAEFCKSTQYQLTKCGGLTWDDLWLSPEEREIVQHKATAGEWITLGKLREMKKEKTSE